VRKIASIFIGFFVAIVIFGIVLSLLWAVGSDSRSFKLISTLSAVAVAAVVSGFAVAGISGSDNLWLPTVSGIVLGGISIGYILGLDMMVLAYAVGFGLLSGSGGQIYLTLFHPLNSEPGVDTG